MKPAIINLLEPFIWFDRSVTRLALKAPTGGLYLRLGEPRFLVRMADGSGYFVEKDEIIGQYIDALLTAADGAPLDGGVSALHDLALPDVMQIRNALFCFFTDAAEAISARKSTPSPSASAASMPTPPSP